MSLRASRKAARFTESVIREMTRLANLHGAVNLSQGFPDFPAPKEIKEAARQAIDADVNQYAITWGAKPLRDAIAAKFERLYGVAVDPERQVTVTCGSTEAIMATLLAVLDPGDEAIVFDDVAFAQYLVKDIGVAVVPGSSFYDRPQEGRRQVRFAFCKKDETLAEAERRLAGVRPR